MSGVSARDTFADRPYCAPASSGGEIAPRELAEFSSWFEAYAAARFDAAIERDAKSGALDRLAEAAAKD